MSRQRLVVALVVLLASCGGITGSDSAGVPPSSRSPSTTTIAATPTTTLDDPGSTTTTRDHHPAIGGAGTPDPGESSDTTVGPAVHVPDAIMTTLIEDAVRRSGAPADELVVVRADAVEWSDASLGCPEPDVSYAQVVTPGYWVQIRGNGVLYDYRVVSSGDFRLCDAGSGNTLVVPDPPAKGALDPIPPPGDPDT